MGTYLIIFFLSLLLLLWLYILWVVGYKKYFLDKFRQQLFELRDQLFDFALEGNIAFSSEVYREFRNNINARIRYAHRINLVDLVSMNLAHKKLKILAKEIKSSLSFKVNQLENEENKQFLNDLLKKSDYLAAEFFIKSNLTIWFLAFFLFVFILMKSFVDILKKIPSKESKDPVIVLERKLDPFWELPIIEENARKNKPAYVFYSS